MLEIAKEVVVALVRSVLPTSVVDEITAERLALSWPPTLRVEVIVEEPVTARALVVAPIVVRLVKSALVAKKFVEVAFVVVALTEKRLGMSALSE